MLVDVFLLRRDGVKLAPEAVQATAPVRGHLCISTYHRRGWCAPDLAPSTTSATLYDSPNHKGLGMLGLDDARVTRMDAAGIVITGHVTEGHPTVGRRMPQAWWCRPVVLGSDAAPAVASCNGDAVPA